MALPEEYSYTIKDIYNLTNGQRAELIDGKMYMMAPPNRFHQEIVGELYAVIRNHIKSKRGSCKPYVSPFAVYLNDDNKNYVEPDISVICDQSKLNENGCNGAPDWIIEVVSPGSKRMDYMIKLFKYRSTGVKEYWVADPKDKTVIVYDFVNNDMEKYTFSEEIESKTCSGLSINLKELLDIE